MLLSNQCPIQQESGNISLYGPMGCSASPSCDWSPISSVYGANMAPVWRRCFSRWERETFFHWKAVDTKCTAVPHNNRNSPISEQVKDSS
ncbi:hypothetical protein XELAEV_18036921mg [Xenopus laevis]|uniref:Uncharacterized protein n=1 Tax=Xenopus laevis TaxID=8355 RepID=A0A974H9X6_XENLA|nr:hypothetical protein XELAEV_18036921mg [Xenopus laevis]